MSSSGCRVRSNIGRVAAMERKGDSKISKTEYEVFLSFRGPDTRQGFTDVVYGAMKDSGIRAFRDDNELAIGDKIGVILDAIESSKICVPIFSKSFASSPWCLREVAKMVELNKDIVPIFYDVKPDDVKLQTTLYVNQLSEHKKKYGKEQVEEWEQALEKVARIKGRSLKETGFVEFFSEEILIKLKAKVTETHQSEADDFSYNYKPTNYKVFSKAEPSFSYMPTYKVFCKAEPNLSLTIRNDKVILARSDPNNLHQHWYKDDKFSTQVRDGEGFPCFSLVNKATGQAMKHSLGGGPHLVGLGAYSWEGHKADQRILWSKGKDLGNGYGAIRMVNNIALNLDAFGGSVHDGTNIGLWEWNQGDNQCWKITPY